MPFKVILSANDKLKLNKNKINCLCCSYKYISISSLANKVKILLVSKI